MENNFVFVVHCQRISRRAAYYLSFPINDQLIQRIKDLPHDSRKWDAESKLWEVTSASLLALIKQYKGSKKIRFDFGDNEQRMIFLQQIKKIEAAEEEKKKQIEELEKKKEYWVKYKGELEKTYINYSEKIHSYLKEGIKLYPHQIVAILFMNEIKNTLLALSMGTGKSVCAIGVCEMNNFQKIIVITPKSLMFNYYNEIEKFTNSKTYIVNWKKNKYNIEESRYIIINYEFFNSSKKDHALNKWKCLNIPIIDAVILDECQKIKNSDTNIYKNYKRIFNEKIFRNGNRFSSYLSGTPMINRARELYTVLHEISPIDFKTKKYFYEFYCGMKYDLISGYGWTIDEAETKFEELFYKISPFTYRKKLEDVIKDLPEKSYEKIIFELSDSEQKLYNEIELGAYNEFTKEESKNTLTVMLRLRQYTSHCKTKYIYELIDNILEYGEKLVVFDVFKESLKIIHDKYPNVSVLHTGDEKVEERNESIRLFQDKSSNIKLFLTTFASGNFGLTLTEANKEILLTLPYSLGEYSQASARIFRIGQKNNVIIYPAIFRDTIDDYVYSMIESKQLEFSSVMDNVREEQKINESVFYDVIEKIKNKYKNNH
jgi:SNF2 family DNA or RNA helicase